MTKAISIDESNAIKGLAIILIIVHHFEQSIISIDILTLFNAMGPVGCSAFFFVSGYGLSASKSPKNLSYWIRRLLKIFIPFILANVLYILFMGGLSQTVGNIVLMLLGIKLINTHCWFIHALLFMYMGYILGAHCKRKAVLIISTMLMGLLYTAITMSPGTISWIAFPLGILISERKSSLINTNIMVFQALNFVLLIASLIMYIQNDCLLNSIFLILNYAVLVVSSALVFICIRKFIVKSKVLKYIGKHSIDYFLVHGLCLSLITLLSSNNHSILFLLFLLFVFAAATSFGFINSIIQKWVLK